MADPEQFRELLTEAVYRIQSYEEGKPLGLIQDELGFALGKKGGGSAIEYWRGGRIPNTGDLKRLTTEIVQRSDLDEEWVLKFLETAEYPHPEALCNELFRSAAPEHSLPIDSKDAETLRPVRTIPLSLTPENEGISTGGEQNSGARTLTRVLDFLSELFVANDAGVDEKIMRGFASVMDRITRQVVLSFLVFSALWIASVELVAPILQWPFADREELFWACVWYAVAALAMPAVISFVAPVDSSIAPEELSAEEKGTLALLKFLGALVGFAGFSGALLFLAGVSFHLGYSICSARLCHLLVLIPLFFSFAGARRIPRIRHKWYGKPKLHEVDKLFLSVFVFFGPFLALFIYYGYPIITQRLFGLAVIGAGIGLVMLEMYRRQSDSFSERFLIFYLGLGLPVGLATLIFFGGRSIESAPSLAEWEYFSIALVYLLSFSLLGATLLVKRLYTLTIRGLLGFAGVLLVFLLAARFNIWLGRSMLILAALAWGIWGRVRLMSYLYFHPSLWLLLVALFCSIGAAVWTAIPIWINVLVFASVALLLLYWASLADVLGK